MGYLEDRANLAGKVAVVIGGGRGVGGAVTMALAKAGVDIAFCDISASAVEATRAEIEQLGRRVTAQRADAFDLEELGAFYDTFDNTFDRLDVLVNVVGGSVKGDFADSS